MRKRNLIVALVMSFGLVQAALAAGGMAGAARSGGMPGGTSGDHMSTSGQTNSNAQFDPDAKRGLDRAEERMNDQGATHEKATAQTKQQAKIKKTHRKTKRARSTGDNK